MRTRAIILSGGRSNRLDGVHKPAVQLGGVTAISRILSAVRAADRLAEVWVAGPTDGLSETETGSVQSVREEPAFAGPLAGIAAACSAIRGTDGVTAHVTPAPTAHLQPAPTDDLQPAPTGDLQPAPTGDLQPEPTEDVTLVLAGDMPLITAGHLGDLTGACRRTDSPASGTDDRGKIQFLCTAWPTKLLLARLEAIGDPVNGAVRLLFEGLDPTLVDVDPAVLADFDTAEDLDRIHAHFNRDH